MYLSDMHTHSIASGHGTACTISDMAKAASVQGLKLLGITDHGPATLAAGTPSYFRSLTYAPRRRFGVEMMYGVELNILDPEGRVDLEDDLLDRLDYAIASMHKRSYGRHTRQENTLAFLNVMNNPHVKILGHCDNTCYPIDYEAVVKRAKEKGVFMEVNEASLAPGGYRGDTRANCFEILRWCAYYEAPVLLSSDSHGAAHIGDFTYAEALIHEAMFPERLIWNNKGGKLGAALRERL